MFKIFLFILIATLQSIYAENQGCPVYLESDIEAGYESEILIILNIFFGLTALILMYIYFKKFR